MFPESNSLEWMRWRTYLGAQPQQIESKRQTRFCISKEPSRKGTGYTVFPATGALWYKTVYSGNLHSGMWSLYASLSYPSLMLWHNGTQHNGTQHIMTLNIRGVAFYLPLCSMSSCWVSLCWVSNRRYLPGCLPPGPTEALYVSQNRLTVTSIIM